MKAFLKRIGAAIACLGGALTGAAPQNLSADPGGLLGAKLSVVQKSDDFFTFFNFASIGEEKQPDGARTTSFKPTGEAFRALVTLMVKTDGRDVITNLRLVVARAFIDDPAKCVYAADLVKSFLGNAAATSSADAVGVLAREISARSISRSSTTILTAQPLPKASGTPSSAYRTYAGDAQPQMLLYPSGNAQLILENKTEANAAVLVLTVQPVAKGK